MQWVQRIHHGGGGKFGNPQGLSRPLQELLYLFSCPLLPFISPLILTLFSLDFICFSPTLLYLLSSCSMFLWPVLFRYSLNRKEYKPKLVGMRERKTGGSQETTTKHLRVPVPGEIKRNTPHSWDKRQPWTVVHTLRVVIRLCYIFSLAHRSKCPCCFHQRRKKQGIHFGRHIAAVVKKGGCINMISSFLVNVLIKARKKLFIWNVEQNLSLNASSSSVSQIILANV